MGSFKGCFLSGLKGCLNGYSMNSFMGSFAGISGNFDSSLSCGFVGCFMASFFRVFLGNI
jgi:hypothetical protein